MDKTVRYEFLPLRLTANRSESAAVSREWAAHVGGAIAVLTSTALLVLGTVPAGADAEKLYQEQCAVCHGADFGGYIGPGLNRDTLARHNEAYLQAKITTGGVGTLMPNHPSWSRKLSRQEIAELAALIKSTPVRDVAWDIDRVRNSLEVLVSNEAALPGKPAYPIDDIVDLMAVTARGHFASGPAAKIVFFNGRTNQVVGELATRYAPHIVDYHPTQTRWAYVTTDAGYLLKIDLYSTYGGTPYPRGLEWGIARGLPRRSLRRRRLLRSQCGRDPACRHP